MAGTTHVMSYHAPMVVLLGRVVVALGCVVVMLRCVVVMLVRAR